MTTHRLGIVMHGITGRMGYNQHLMRSIIKIIEEGGVKLSNGDRVLPDPLLLGRNPEKITAIAKETGIKRFTTDYDFALNSLEDQLFFDAGSTDRRPELLTRAINNGKHIYCEKPVSLKLSDAIKLDNLCIEKKLKSGVVQDKLYLPGLIKLKSIIEEGKLGDLLAAKIDFGYWVFTGESQKAQRPSWNYKKEMGGGIIFDMLCHWRYVIDHLFGDIASVLCYGKNHIQKRFDENDQAYNADADDAAYAIFELVNGAVVQANSSWCTRVHREDLVTFQADGTKGSAIAGLTKCKYQSLENTPRPVWNPDEPQQLNFYDSWTEIDKEKAFENGFKIQWEKFIKYLFNDGDWKHTIIEGAKGVQLAELAIQSWEERRWIDINKIDRN